MNWRGQWLTATAYAVQDGVYNAGPGSSYICTVSHTSAALTQPGVGANWATVWSITSQGAVGPAGPTGATGPTGPTGPAGPSGGGAVINATSNRTVLDTETGASFTNTGASAQVIFTLPATAVGLRYRFIAMVVGQSIKIIIPAGSILRVPGIGASSSGGSTTSPVIASTQPGLNLELLAVDATTWVSVGASGWTVA